MKYYVLSLLKFALVFFLLIAVQLVFFTSIIAKFASFDIPREKTILILGDSETETALNDTLIKHSINLSQGADAMFYSYMKLKKIYENNPQIETVILGFSPDTYCSALFYDVPVMKARFTNYFYILQYKDFKDILLYSFEGFARGISVLGKYFLKTPHILQTKNIREVIIGGFQPRPIDSTILAKSIIKGEYAMENIPDPLSVKYFDKIVRYCNEFKIKLIVINTPVHKVLIEKRAETKKSYLNFLNARKDRLTLWDCENFQVPDSLFYDVNHFNYKGANLFSIYLNATYGQEISTNSNPKPGT